MIHTWPWWVGGVALALVMLLHWALMQRMMAVSGRISALVDRLRLGRREIDEADDDGDFSPEELALALAEVTEAQFGSAPDAVADDLPTIEVSGNVDTPMAAPALRSPLPLLAHPVFFGGLVVGGLLSALMAGAYSPAFQLSGELFERSLGHGSGAWVALGLGGALVGFGTRMAGGCTTGHGLCGVSRFQSGSLVATASFFGAAVATSFVLWGLR